MRPEGTGTRSQARVAAAEPVPRPTWRRVAIPSEHGGWSLTVEPVLLGLLVAWSWPGLALGLAAVLAFVARTPLKTVLVDRRRGRWYGRSTLAVRIVTAELVVIVLLGLGALAGTRDPWFWVPLAIAAPLVAVQLGFDMSSRSRRLAPELAGVIGISSVAAAIALVDGEAALPAVGLWVVAGARSAAAIPYARTQVFRARRRTVVLWHSDLAQVLGVLAIGAAWLLDAVPLATLVALVAVAAFNVAAVRRAVRPVKQIGLQQMAFGITVVVVTATASLA